MYGQKQILQCLAVALILVVFNFHRAAIKRNKNVAKHKLMIKKEFYSKSELNRSSDSEKMGYCVRYPFGSGNIHYNHYLDCQQNCLGHFKIWLRKQCDVNCCIEQSSNTTNGIPFRSSTKCVQTLKSNRTQRTRICENEPIRIFDENGASLHNEPFESVKTIIEPINEKLMSTIIEEEHQCKIQTNYELICKNTSSHIVEFIKLDFNKTKIMEYNDFLFDMGSSEPVGRTETQSLDRSFTSGFFAFISILIAMLTIRYMFKLFMTDHNEAFLNVLEMRRALNDRLEQIQAELSQTREKFIDNNNDANSQAETINDEAEKESQYKRNKDSDAVENNESLTDSAK
ncbi:uncharacterized protein LOC116345000 [Contarinia nasturtii]|uniref:uncharacterized protein LOC116345000 n=1 Tax=Contarinia nasturtii TaxID=265458 RepID=UPI0012D3B2AC|nr:uncharacterized protein LOC116345000 [Contarinia nasturtii]